MKPKTAIILSAVLVLCVGYMIVRRTGLFEPKPPEADRSIFEPAGFGQQPAHA